MKQTIVLRKDLNMRKGKMIAQGAHASLANILQLQRQEKEGTVLESDKQDLEDWLNESFRKIALSVDSEEELIEIYEKAKALNLNVSLIEDNGVTEFKGVKTKTCLSIGPHSDERINQITSHLKLL